MENDIDEFCEYWDEGDCCNEFVNTDGKISVEYCKSCPRYKIPIEAKAIQLLSQLAKTSSTLGIYLDGYFDYKTAPNTINALEELTKKLKEVEQFLAVLGFNNHEEDDIVRGLNGSKKPNE